MRISTAVASTPVESRQCSAVVDFSPLAVSLVPSDQGKGSAKDLPRAANPAATHDSYDQARHAISRLSIAEGGLALTVLYALIGGGIGALAGSVLLGLVVGFATGVAAIGAILLISGASVVPERAVEHISSSLPRQVFRS